MIRHSSLPKLAECACFESAGGSSPAAERGTKMDAAFRAVLAINDKELFDALEDEEQRAVLWATNVVKDICAEHPVVACEDFLKVVTPGMEHEGTEDARCPWIKTSFDLKTGQICGYYEQMAAYAYGNMEREFVEDWTCHLVFCDQRKVVTHHFTYEQAKEVVESVLEKANDPQKQPSPCDYCGWCAKKETCKVIAVAANDSLEIVDSNPANLAQLKEFLAADSDLLSAFLKKAVIFNDELVDWAKDTIKKRLTDGDEVTGYKLQKQRGQEYVEQTDIAPAFQTVGATIVEIIEFFGGKVKASEMKDFLEKRGSDYSFGTFSGKEIVKLVQTKTKK